jgi:hypothetical protein
MARKIAEDSRSYKTRLSKRKEITIVAPQMFSIVSNPNRMAQFLSTLRAKAATNPIFVDLGDVNAVLPDGVGAFVSVLDSIASSQIRGNQPNRALARDRLHRFGFFDHVKGVPSLVPQQGGIWRKDHGRKVNPRLAGEFSRFATKISGRSLVSLKPSVSTLVELTANTFAHADPKEEGAITWWAGVYFDHLRDRVCFTVIDNGVGVLKSRGIWELLRTAVLSEQAAFLEDILEGRVKSKTRKEHRGLGLPGTLAHWKAGRFKELVVIANEAFYSATHGRARLQPAFNGTMIYWET